MLDRATPMDCNKFSPGNDDRFSFITVDTFKTFIPPAICDINFLYACMTCKAHILLEGMEGRVIIMPWGTMFKTVQKEEDIHYCHGDSMTKAQKQSFYWHFPRQHHLLRHHHLLVGAELHSLFLVDCKEIHEDKTKSQTNLYMEFTQTKRKEADNISIYLARKALTSGMSMFIYHFVARLLRHLGAPTSFKTKTHE